MNTNALQQEWLPGFAHLSPTEVARTETHPAILAQMVEDVLSGEIGDVYDVAWALMGNESVPFAAAEKLAAAWRGEVDFEVKLFSRKDATPEALDAWADLSHSAIAKSIIANHPNTTTETLLRMARTPNPQEAYWVLITGRLPDAVLSAFVTSEACELRKAVAKV